MENHHFEWLNQLFQLPCSIAFSMFTGHVATWNTLEPKDPVKSCAYEFPEVFFVSHTFFRWFLLRKLGRHVKTCQDYGLSAC